MKFYNSKFLQSFSDLRNFFKFRKEIKSEIKRANSDMNKYKLKLNWLGDIVYMQVNCTDGDLMNADYNYERMIQMKIKPVVHYLSTDLGWGDYLVPQISNFVDEDGEPTLSYGILFIFVGYSLTRTKFLFGTLISLLIFGGIIFSLCHFL